MEIQASNRFLSSQEEISIFERSRTTASKKIPAIPSDTTVNKGIITSNSITTANDVSRNDKVRTSPPLWTQFHGSCKRCKQRVTNGEGLFCSNYYAKRGKFPPCLGVWCGGCYVATGKVANSFPVCRKKRQFADDDDNEEFVIDFVGSRGAEEEKEADIHHHDLEKRRFMYGRVGDHLMVHFQCDLCHFRNIRHREPKEHNDEDRHLLMCIRRANLDAFWSRETPTVLANFWEGVRYMENANKIGGLDSRSSTFPSLGPHSIEDTCGMFTAACILISTLNVNATDKCDTNINRRFHSGTNADTSGSAFLRQYDVARKMDSFYSNFWHASIASEERAEMVTKRESNNGFNNDNMFVSSCPIDGPWYEQFKKGMQKRIGCRRHYRPNLNIDIKVMLEIMKMYENRWEEYGGDDSFLWSAESADILFPALYVVISFCGALRGDETCLMDLAGTRNNFDAGMNNPPTRALQHVIVALYCTFKYHICEMYHLIPIAATTASGLQPGLWVGRMLLWYRIRGIRNGPVFRNHGTGQVARRQDFEWNVLSHLSLVQIERPDIIPMSVDIFENSDNPDMNSIFRRGSQTHARKILSAAIESKDIDLSNQWRTFKIDKRRGNSDTENCSNVTEAREEREREEKGREEQQEEGQPQLQIHQLYTDVLQQLPALLKYSSAL